MAFEPAEICKGVRVLSKNDPVLAEVVRNVGPFTLKADPGGFEILVRSILSQQISMAAFRTIRGRLQALLPAGKMTARNMATNLRCECCWGNLTHNVRMEFCSVCHYNTPVEAL